MPKNKKHPKHYIDKKLLFRLRLYIIIGLALGGFVIYEIFKNGVNPLFGLVGLFVGIVVGGIVGRMYKLSWKQEEAKVVSQLDLTGFVILGIYLVFAIFKDAFFGQYIHGSILSVFTLSITAGTMLGRVIFMTRGIRDLIEAAGF